MKNLKTILLATVMVAGVANADCCVTKCCQVTECVQTTTMLVPYQVCETVCVPVTDACGNVLCYKEVKQLVTKYKEVKVEKIVACCSN